VHGLAQHRVRAHLLRGASASMANGENVGDRSIAPARSIRRSVAARARAGPSSSRIFYHYGSSKVDEGRHEVDLLGRRTPSWAYRDFFKRTGTMMVSLHYMYGRWSAFPIEPCMEKLACIRHNS
jgi:hypothetical protein